MGLDRLLPARQQLTQKFPVVGEQAPNQELNQQNWRLTLAGGGNDDQTIGFDDLLAMPQTELTHDIHCVTRWSRQQDSFTGVLFKDLLSALAIAPQTQFVRFVAYSHRNHDTSLPLAVCLQENLILAHKINGQPLLPQHGFPVRTFAPSRYFYKSLKWLKHIEFIAQDQLGFWERGGYHNNADYQLEQRYVSGNLTTKELTKLRQSLNFKKYHGQVLLSLDLSGLDLSGADLRGVQLKNCNLQGCNFTAANLREANLSNSSLLQSNLHQADLTGADLDGVLLMGCDLTQATLDHCLLNATEFIRHGYADAHISGASFRGAQRNGLIESQQAFLTAHGAEF